MCICDAQSALPLATLPQRPARLPTRRQCRGGRATFLFGWVFIWVATLLTSLTLMWSPTWMNEDGPVEIIVGLLHVMSVSVGSVTLLLLPFKESWIHAPLAERIAWWLLSACAACSLWLYWL